MEKLEGAYLVPWLIFDGPPNMLTTDFPFHIWIFQMLMLLSSWSWIHAAHTNHAVLSSSFEWYLLSPFIITFLRFLRCDFSEIQRSLLVVCAVLWPISTCLCLLALAVCG